MTDHQARGGHELFQAVRHLQNGAHPVVQEKHLAAPVQLALDRVADHALVVLCDNRLHRQPVMRRRLDGAHVPRAGQRKVEGAGNGRGTQGEHVHQRAQAFEFFLV